MLIGGIRMSKRIVVIKDNQKIELYRHHRPQKYDPVSVNADNRKTTSAMTINKFIYILTQKLIFIL